MRDQGKRTMQRLRDAAMVAFDRRGYHATRVNDIVEIAKTSHGTFYLYFSNKEDLLRALLVEATDDVREIDKTLSSGPAGTELEQLRAWVGAYSSVWRRYAPLLGIWTELTSSDPEVAQLLGDSLRSMTGALASWIDVNGVRGEVDPSVAAVAVVAMLDRFHQLQNFLGGRLDDATLDALTTILERAALGSSGRPVTSDGLAEPASARSGR